MKKAAFTLCSNNYLAQAITLGNSFLSFHKDYNFYIGLVDHLNKDIDYKSLKPLRVLPLGSFTISGLREMVEKYNIIELNTSVKAHYFEYFLSNYEIVKYIDPDIMFYNTLNELDEIHSTFDIILTPHITKPIPISASQPQENIFLKFGLYNLGFLSLKKTTTSVEFVEWWKDRLTNLCYKDAKKGLFVDQKWINFVPIFWKDNTYISYDLGLNMAYWNIHERNLDFDPESLSYTVNKSDKLKFFHFSSFDPSDNFSISKRSEIILDERSDLKPIFEIYRKKMLGNNYDFYKKIKIGFNINEKKSLFNPKGCFKKTITKARVFLNM